MPPKERNQQLSQLSEEQITQNIIRIVNRDRAAHHRDPLTPEEEAAIAQMGERFDRLGVPYRNRDPRDEDKEEM